MKRYFAILPALFLLALFFGMTSCTKKEKPDTLYTRLEGQWKKTQYATDDNNNGVIDPQEIHQQASSQVDVIVFSSDTLGYEKTIVNNNVASESVLNFQWYINGDSVVVAYAAHLNVTYFIQDVNSLNLTLITNTSKGLAAYYYSKQ